MCIRDRQNSYQNKTMQFGIVGLGLIGGSIAKALKARNFEVFAEDLNRNYLEAATKEGLITGSINEIDQEKEFILIICVPVSAYADIFSHHKDLMTKAQLVTDCASVKNTLSDELNSHPSLQKNYVFSHPMAGSERSGFFHSDKDLFKELFEDKGVVSCRTGKCSNQDGRLGFSCPMDYEKAPHAIGITELDHIDGNRYNNTSDNIQELCNACHVHKGKLSGDLSKQNRYKNSKTFKLIKGGNYV